MQAHEALTPDIAGRVLRLGVRDKEGTRLPIARALFLGACFSDNWCCVKAWGL